MEPSPADAVRRALRAARERREAAPDAAGEQGPAEPSDGWDSERGAPASEELAAGDYERRGARPGDAARAALRRAVVARRGGSEGAEEEAAQDSEGAASDGEKAVSEGGPVAARSAADEDDAEGDRDVTRPAAVRPADVAREALRAAMEDRRRAEAEEPDRSAQGARRVRRPAATTGSDARRGGEGRTDSLRGRAESMRVRDVQSLLAGAFRMPSSDSPSDASSDSSSDSPQGDDSGPPDPTDRHSAPTDAAASAVTPPTAPSSWAGSDPSPAPAAPQVPRSMAAPARDGELRRTFPAFAPRPSDDERFAESWWGDAWVTALEEGALDAKRLVRGRGYAQEGHVDAITVTPGLVLAYVRGSRPRPYRVQVRLRTLDDADWARFLDAVAERPGHIAALLDKEMPQSLAECGVPLLPGPGDLEPRCSCPDRGHPCKHAAALCYQTARLLDADPFVLLLLRGRGERELLDSLSRLSAARAARAAQEQKPAPLAGVRATDALAPDRRLPPLPAPLPTPPHPEQPPVYPASPGGPDSFALDQLATEAAARAHALLGTGRDPVAELTLWQDAIRLAAARPGSGLTASTRALYSSLASAADRTPAELARAVAAWRQGGLEGLIVLEEPWDPPAGRFDRARPLLLAADLPAFRPWHNRLTHPRGHLQLRLGRDGLWYPYESEPGHDDWWPRGTPDLDPVGALTGLDLGAAPES
ncbi:SWIM zinc finger family protein [Streptomyces sp. NPDC001928]|uniref:SWIM zinc finger family protein n=1 Tax=Streptomyces sp. NPDC001928 TaxID=3154404 RepID=UPI00331E100F